jgi:hypothetical protein
MGCQSGAANRRAGESPDPVSHVWIDGRLVTIAEAVTLFRDALSK